LRIESDCAHKRREEVPIRSFSRYRFKTSHHRGFVADLVATLRIVVDRLKANRDLYQENEAAVRGQLVEPVLRSLGWDTDDPGAVRPNLSTEEGFPDYTLFEPSGKKSWVLEAKKGGTDILGAPKAVHQAGKYAFDGGVKHFALCNGSVWALYRTFEEGTDVGDRLIWSVDLESEDSKVAGRKLALLTRDKIAGLETLVKKADRLDDAWEAVTQAPDEIASALVPLVRKRVTELGSDLSFSDEELGDLLRDKLREAFESEETEEARSKPAPSGTTSPPSASGTRQIHLGKERFPVRFSYEVLTKTCEWLISQGKLTAKDCPIVAGHKRNLVNTTPTHRYGGSFLAPHKLSNGLFVEAHWSATNAVERTRRLLRQFGFPDGTLRLE
jgi:hypothetical protein